MVRFGACAWGVQFHPEVDADRCAVWAASVQEPDPADTVADDVLDAIRAQEQRLAQTWQPMAKAFAAQLG